MGTALTLSGTGLSLHKLEGPRQSVIRVLLSRHCVCRMSVQDSMCVSSMCISVYECVIVWEYVSV